MWQSLLPGFIKLFFNYFGKQLLTLNNYTCSVNSGIVPANSAGGAPCMAIGTFYIL